MEKSRVYISDIHVNAGKGINAKKKFPYEWLGPREAKIFEEFLKYTNSRQDIREFIILGDLLDDWVYPVDMEPPSLQQIIKAPINKGIVRELKKLSKKKDVRVIYLPGNHDMGVTRELVENNFPGMIFGGTALNDSVYRSSRLRAEHGSAHAMFNAADAINNSGVRLPLGYFISRVNATQQYNTGSGDRHYWSYADDLIETLGPQRLASSVFEAVLEEAGLDENRPIIMPKKNGTKIQITGKEVKQKYAHLYDQWKETHGQGKAFKAILAEIGLLGKTADALCKKRDTNIVIFGHSHDWKLDKDSWFVNDRMYANCGTWCDEKKPCTYVESQKNRKKGEHIVRVMEWKNKKAHKLNEEAVPL